MKKKLVVGVMGSASITESITYQTIAAELSQALLDNNCILLTGETTGLPALVVKEHKLLGGFAIGISPAKNSQEHQEYYKLGKEQSDLTIYTGFGLSGRNTLNIRSSDIVLILAGSVGTLNEFTAACAEDKVIGVLEGSGGIADKIKDLLGLLQKKAPIRVIFANEVKSLLKQCIVEYQKTKH